MPTDYFGGHVAAGYDALSAGMFDPAVLDPTVDLLAGLAGDGRALELGVGTGRVALPLSQPRRARARDRPVARHGGRAAGQARAARPSA